MDVPETLRLTFEIPFGTKVNYFRNGLSDYIITRSQAKPLTDLYRYFERGMATCSFTRKKSFSLLPVAVCSHLPANMELVPPPGSYTYLPLVAEEVWSHIVTTYPYNALKIIIEKRPQIDLSLPQSLSFFHRELKALDISYYFPERLQRSKLFELSDVIFHKDTHIKDSLRRGVWMHLLQVFPPSLITQDERSGFIQKLRRIYSTLKNKLFAEREAWPQEYIHLHDSIQRDAVRTDPSESFLNEETNIELLIDIIMVYTLEHKANIKYTQGMTDLLSPILYVMENEADAYICFSALFNRLKDNFTEWCEGALNRVERLRHLCEVLDPVLFHHLVRGGEEVDDPFVLFFGMILIECRREFTFEECLHLLEVMWSVSLPRDTPTDTSELEWALFMTTESMGVVREVFGVGGALSYSAHPLSLSEMTPPLGHRSTHPLDIPSCSSSSYNSPNYLTREDDEEEETEEIISVQGNGRDRSVSLPEVAGAGYVIINGPIHSPMQGTKSEGHLPLEEEEVRDSLGDLESSTKMSRRVQGLPPTNEMSDLSSFSSANTTSSVNGGGMVVIGDSPLPPRRKTTKQLKRNDVKSEQGHTCNRKEGANVSQDARADGKNEGVDVKNENMDGETKEEDMHNELLDNVIPSSLATLTDETKSNPELQREDLQNSHTLPRSRTRSYRGFEYGTLPRPSNDSSLSPSLFIKHLSNPGMASPYVSGIRPFESKLLTSDSEQSTPYRSRTNSRLSQSQAAAILESLDEGKGERATEPSPLTDGSLQVSMVLSQLVSNERARPVINRTTSLNVRLNESFSLFVCLAILMTHRERIIERQVDFVSLSMILNSETKSDLDHILKVSRQLYQNYTYYQSISDSFTWLDDNLPSFNTSSQTTPLDTPSSIRRAYQMNSTGTNCSINNTTE